MTLHQLTYFVAVAEELHFGRAAERVGIAQPPLTQQIHKLEKELGYPLLHRTTRKTQLTEAGAVLLERARIVLLSLDEAIERTRAAGRGETGHLTVGTPPSVMLTRLPIAIRKYRAKFPGVRFALQEGSTSAIAEGLRAGRLDMGFLREVQLAGPLQVELVIEEPLVAVLPIHHALAGRRRLTLNLLARAPFVLFPRAVGEAFYDRIVGMCVAAGFSPSVVQEATQWQSVVTFVEAGVGISIAPACVARLGGEAVVYRPLVGLTTSVYVCRQAIQHPASDAFLRFVRHEMSSPR